MLLLSQTPVANGCESPRRAAFPTIRDPEHPAKTGKSVPRKPPEEIHKNRACETPLPREAMLAWHEVPISTSREPKISLEIGSLSLENRRSFGAQYQQNKLSQSRVADPLPLDRELKERVTGIGHVLAYGLQTHSR